MTDGSVSISALVTVVTTIMSVAAGGYAVLLRFSFAQYQALVDKRFADLERASDEDEKELKQQVDRLTHQNHELEKTGIRLEGEVKRLTESHDRSVSDLDSIKETIETNMVRKDEWSTRMERLEGQVDTILKELRAGASTAGRYGSGSSQRYPAVTGVEVVTTKK